MAVEAATAGAASEPGSAAWLTFLLRPEQSCVARVTCTVLYTLNHSGWWHICDRLERQARQHEKLRSGGAATDEAAAALNKRASERDSAFRTQ